MYANIQQLANTLKSSIPFIDDVKVYLEQLKFKEALDDRSKFQCYIRLAFDGVDDFRYDQTEQCNYDTEVDVVIVFKLQGVKLPCELHDHLLYFIRDAIDLKSSSFDTGRIFTTEFDQEFKGDNANMYRFEGSIVVDQQSLGRRCNSLDDLLDC